MNCSRYFSLNIYYGGELRFVKFKRQYVGGESVVKSGIDRDLFGYFELRDYMRELGFHSWEKLWFKLPRTNAYEEIKDDQGILKMLSYVGKFKSVSVFVEGGKAGEGNDVRDGEGSVEKGGEKVGEGTGEKAEEGSGEKAGEGVGDTEDYEDEQGQGYEDQWTGDWQGIVSEEDNEQESESDGDGSDHERVQWSDGENSDLNSYLPSDTELSDVSLRDLDYISDEENVRIRRNKEVGNVFDLIDEDDGFELEYDTENVSEYEDGEKEYDTSETDEECDEKMRKKRVVYDPRCDHKSLVLVLGMYILDGYQCRQALTNWAIDHQRFIRFRSVSKYKCLAKCSPPCEWKIYASAVKANGTFMLKSYAADHTCMKTMSNKLLSSKWIAKRYLSSFRQRYDIDVQDLATNICERFGVRVPKNRLYKARRMAQLMVRGSVDSHYGMMRRYVAELKRIDHEGKFELVLKEDNVFESLYVGLSALRKGFLASCRPVISIDGCFLKTYLGGFLLCATGKDGNNGMFPIGWAVVEGENEVSWSWFLKCLVEDLRLGDGRGWTFISDQQKGLINAVAKLTPKAEHRNCCRHIYMNWKKHHKGETLKRMFFAAAYATYEQQFKEAVLLMKAESQAAFDDFMARDTSKFCKAFVSTNPSSDCVDNNISETFNSWIRKARGKHVIHMCEEIRRSLMVRQLEKFNEMRRVTGKLTPSIQATLENHKSWSVYCEAIPGMDETFEVFCDGEKYVCHIKTGKKGINSCSCRAWDLTGIPCKHAIAGMRFMEKDPTEYVSDYYTVERYMSSFEYKIPSTLGEKMWPEVAGDVVKPPGKLKMPGRPKKKRIRAPEEKNGRMTKHGIIIRCGNCKEEGHNRVSCKKPAVVEEPVEKRKRGRPAKPKPTSEVPKKDKQPAKSKKKQKATSDKSAFFRDRAIANKGMDLYINEETGNSFYKPSLSSNHCVNMGKYKSPRMAGEGTSSRLQASYAQSGLTDVPISQESRVETGPGEY